MIMILFVLHLIMMKMNRIRQYESIFESLKL